MNRSIIKLQVDSSPNFIQQNNLTYRSMLLTHCDAMPRNDSQLCHSVKIVLVIIIRGVPRNYQWGWGEKFSAQKRMKICLFLPGKPFLFFKIHPPPHFTHVGITYYIIIDIFSGHGLLANSSMVIRITLTHSSVYVSASGIRLVESLSHKPSPPPCVIHGRSQSGRYP